MVHKDVGVRVVSGSTFAEAYRGVLSTIFNEPDFVSSPRGLEIREVMNLAMVVYDPTSNMFINAARSTPKRYLAGEILWYFLGRNDLEFISKYSSFWERIANKDDTLNSAYGHLLFTERNEHGYNEWTWAFESLRNDKDTRQAIIRFNKPHHGYKWNKDFVCTLAGNFLIRDDDLHFTVVMRSQDEVLGRTFDVPFFALLQQQMRRHLLQFYPTLGLGTFTHINMSSHIYSHNFSTVKKMLETDFIPDGLPPLGVDLVDPYGNPTEDFLSLCSSVIDGEDFEHSDPLLSWVFDHARDK
jgi:thymidylate synthase